MDNIFKRTYEKKAACRENFTEGKKDLVILAFNDWFGF
jgi:hypothetical protein